MGDDGFAGLARACRSYRRFDEKCPVPREALVRAVECARVSASAGNAQELRFHVVSDPEECARTFRHLKWAALYRDWDGPAEGERPTGYVVIVAPAPAAPIRSYDTGIAAQSIMLSVTEAGFGGCMLKSVTPGLLGDLGIDEGTYALELVCAVGMPGERVVLEALESAPDGTAYWRDAEGTHHVPKRSLEDLLV